MLQVIRFCADAKGSCESEVHLSVFAWFFYTSFSELWRRFLKLLKMAGRNLKTSEDTVETFCETSVGGSPAQVYVPPSRFAKAGPYWKLGLSADRTLLHSKEDI